MTRYRDDRHDNRSNQGQGQGRDRQNRDGQNRDWNDDRQEQGTPGDSGETAASSSTES